MTMSVMLTTTPLAQPGPYDEALERYHRTGPEFDGYLSNHGPMVVEALARLGHGEQIHAWSDDYLSRLDEVPRSVSAIAADDWREALGDAHRSADWITFFRDRSREQSWEGLLATWWPRLLPGIAAGATHGVIRVGHAVRALRAADTEPRRAELSHALAYWAARWQPVPLVRATGSYDVASTLARIPRVATQELGIRHRLAQLPTTTDWQPTLRSLAGPARPEDVPAALVRLISGVLARYATHAHGNPTMMVHAATAPMAVLNSLPSLPTPLWHPSFDAAWTATGAVLAAYAPAEARPAPVASSAADTLDQALRHGGEHVVKLTDTALRIHDLTGAEHALAAAGVAIRLDA